VMMGVYAIVEATNYGWGSAHTLGFGAGAVALLVAFVVREQRAANPLVPLQIFRSRNLSGANAIQALMVAGIYAMFFLGALYLQKVLGFDSLEVGLAFIPMTAIIGILSLGFSAKLNMRFGARATLLPGLVSVGAGLLLLSQISADGSYWSEVLPAMVLVGIGAGLSFPSIMTLAMTGVKPEEAGLASGLVNTTMQVGGALGLAVLATLSTSRPSWSAPGCCSPPSGSPWRCSARSPPRMRLRRSKPLRPSRPSAPRRSRQRPDQVVYVVRFRRAT
jgi:predicted MFS family arabinose efflux permease